MIKDIPALLEKVKQEIRAKTDIAVIGLSGGADSTLVACLCSIALGKENVWGLHMPYSEIDHLKFNANSQKVARQLGINNAVVPIKDAAECLSDDVLTAVMAPHDIAQIDTIEEVYGKPICELSQLNQGNMRSRMRMVALYTFNCAVAEATGKRCRVIGTGNISEDFIFYETKHGDSACDFFPIGQLFKSEVYQLLEYFVSKGILKEENIDRIPSAGLWNEQTDQKELGYSYDEMEPSILRCMDGTQDMNNKIDKFVWERHISGKHKHDAAPVIDLGDFRRGYL